MVAVLRRCRCARGCSGCCLVRLWGRAAWCARGRRPAREIATREPAARSGRSRSPARPRRCPRAPQPGPPVPPVPFTPVGLVTLMGGSARRLVVWPSPTAAHGPAVRPCRPGGWLSETGVAFAGAGRASTETVIAFAGAGRAPIETAIAFARLCLCGSETAIAFAGAGRASTETVVAFAGAGRASIETVVAFAGGKWAFLVRFSGAEVMSVSRVHCWGRAEAMPVSRLPCWG